MTGSTRRHGDVFPLPLPSVEPPAKSRLSRGVRQRIGRRRAVQSDSYEAIRSLILLAGCGRGSDPAYPQFNSPASMPSDVEAFIGGRIAAFAQPPVRTQEESLMAILRADTLYHEDGSANQLRSYESSLLSVPTGRGTVCNLF